MEFLKQETVDGTERNLDALYQLFPQCFTEAIDETTGKVTRRVVDFQKLRELLGDFAEEDTPEAYEFTWVGKNAAKREAARPIRKTLRPCEEESVDWETTKNLYIEGDNLEVLKLLQSAYMGKVKMIYIDPPYNTGNDFVYHDNYSKSKSEYDLESGDIDEFGIRYRVNSKSEGKFHSDWCSMMYSRLLVARSLLAEDGVIFLSIDDNEVKNLQNICDEVFGEDNFIGIFVWVKKKKGSHLSRTLRSMTEYVLCYCRHKDILELYGEDAYSDKLQPIVKRTNSIKTLKIPANIIQTKLKDDIYSGAYGEGTTSLVFQNFEVSNGIVITECVVTGPFVWTQEKLDEEIALGTQFYLSNKFGFNVLRSNQTEKIKRPSTLIDSKLGVGTNEDAYNEAIALFGKEGIMSYPKPVSLMTYLINQRTHFDKESIVLDFFSGSATTAHAVMQLNASDGGKRKFIMVQLPEETPKESEALKAGFANICEIGKERIRRAGKKVKEEAGLQGQDLDTGFRVLKLDESNMQDVYFHPKGYSQSTLDLYINNVKEGRSDLDLLFGCMLDWGVQLSLPLAKQEVDNCDVYVVNNGDMVACFSDSVSEKVIDAIAELMPVRVVFRDSCFADASSKMNLFELFKQKCGWSEEEARNNIRVI